MKNQKLKLTALISAAAMLFTACAGNDPTEPPDESADPDTSASETKETTPDSDMNSTPDTDNDRVYKEDSGFPYAVSDDVKITYEFTEEDDELHEILEELDPAWTVFVSFRSGGFDFYEVGNDIEVVFPQKQNALCETFALLLEDKLPFSTIDEMETEIRKYFSEAVAKEYLGLLRPAKGEIVSEEDGVYEVILPDEYGYFDDNGVLFGDPILLELDGKLYRTYGGVYPNIGGIDYYVTRILSRTDDEIIFAYLIPARYEEHTFVTGKAALKYEDGWKYDWNLEYPDNEDEFLDFYEVWVS